VKRTYDVIDTHDAILDERGGCLNTSESVPAEYSSPVVRKSGVVKEWEYASSMYRTYRENAAIMSVKMNEKTPGLY